MEACCSSNYYFHYKSCIRNTDTTNHAHKKSDRLTLLQVLNSTLINKAYCTKLCRFYVWTKYTIERNDIAASCPLLLHLNGCRYAFCNLNRASLACEHAYAAFRVCSIAQLVAAQCCAVLRVLWMSATEFSCQRLNFIHFYSAPQCWHCKRCTSYSNSVWLCLFVCLSVRPSHAGIVSKRPHVARCNLNCWIAKCV